jgi:hypothetical protein
MSFQPQAGPELPGNEDEAEDRERGHDPCDHTVATHVHDRLDIVGEEVR